MADPQQIPRTAPPDPGPLGPPPPLFERPPAAPPLFFGGLVLLLVLGITALVWPSSAPPPLPDEELALLITPDQRSQGPPARPGSFEEFSPAGGAAGAGHAAGGPSFAELRLTVDGADATVWIDGDRAGSTPLHLDPVTAGPREVRVSRGEVTLMDTVLYIRSGALVHFHVVEPAGGAVAETERQPPARATRRPATQRSRAQSTPPPSTQSTRPRVGW